MQHVDVAMEAKDNTLIVDEMITREVEEREHRILLRFGVRLVGLVAPL